MMKEESLGFSDFRYWMDVWDEAVDKEKRKEKIKSDIESEQLVFFFTKGNNFYGAPEMSRVTFAKLKEPDEEVPPGWAEEADFAALDLKKLIRGDKTEHLFTSKDMKDIKIMDAEVICDKVVEDN